MDFRLFPWENDEKPYFVNDEGFEWYLDKDTNNWLKKDMENGVNGIKDMACFFVKKGEDVTRVLIDSNQKIIKSDKSWESMLCYIDIIKLDRSYSTTNQ